jgi:hypothetical protein
MARRSRTAVLKRQREAKKAEKAQMKRDKRQLRETDQSGGQVATVEDLEGYGFVETEAPSDRRRPEPR